MNPVFLLLCYAAVVAYLTIDHLIGWRLTRLAGLGDDKAWPLNLNKGGGGGTPKQETDKQRKERENKEKKEQKKQAALQQQMLDEQRASSAQISKNMEQSQKTFQEGMIKQQEELKKIPVPEVTPTPPPPSESASDVEDSQRETRRNASKRKGLLSTTYAGSTGGYGGTPMGGNRSLLG